MHWMIYGAYGFTAKKILAKAVAKGHRPLLAGRDEAKLQQLASRYDLEYVACSIDETVKLNKAASGAKVVLNAAGPFTKTALPIIDACVNTKAHYVDITAEMVVLDMLYDEHQRANEAGITICPAAGFDVIPTDCLAATLSKAMPDATHLALSLDSEMSVSPGTAKSALELLPLGGVIRKNGELTAISRNKTLRHIKLEGHDKPVAVAAMPWGDLVTAWVSTGIQNVEVLLPLRAGRLELWLEPLIKHAFKSLRLRRWATNYIDKKMPFPSDEEMESTPVQMWGEVRNAAGSVIRGKMHGPNGYKLTIDGALLVIEALLNNNTENQTGFVTPSRLLGEDIATEKLGCSSITLSAVDAQRLEKGFI